MSTSGLSRTIASHTALKCANSFVTQKQLVHGCAKPFPTSSHRRAPDRKHLIHLIFTEKQHFLQSAFCVRNRAVERGKRAKAANRALKLFCFPFLDWTLAGKRQSSRHRAAGRRDFAIDGGASANDCGEENRRREDKECRK